MRSLLTLAVLAGVLAAGPAPALAFSQSTHRTTTYRLCVEAGLPDSFCDRVGLEAANVDGSEWDDAAAHGQMVVGWSTCQSADAVVARLVRLHDSFRTTIDTLAATPPGRWYKYGDLSATIARELGRALHTLQDNRAHQGMPNPEHAWFSLGDQCGGPLRSPDSDAAALEEARRVTRNVLGQMAAVVRSAGVERVLAEYSCEPQSSESGGTAACGSNASPLPWDACGFLAEAEHWDGVDRRWNIAATEPSFLEAFLNGLAVELCADPEIDAPPLADVDVSRGTPSCPAIHVLCLGHADGQELAVDDSAAPAADTGCSVAGVAGSDGGVALFALLLMAGALSSNRSRRRG
jgi:hypothetical protein